MPEPVAFDIETCPLPMDTFTARQKRRYDKEFAHASKKDATASLGELSRKVRSLNPWLGWICCISVAFRHPRDGYQTTSWTAATPDEEGGMLRGFWVDVEDLFRSWLFVGFNSKYFDAPFIRDRSLAHGLRLPPVAGRILSTHRWRNAPHCDVAHLVHPHRVGLADLCELLGVETPKNDIDGSQVAACVERGEIVRVARYCEADTRATLECYDTLAHLAAPVIQ